MQISLNQCASHTRAGIPVAQLCVELQANGFVKVFRISKIKKNSNQYVTESIIQANKGPQP